MVRNVLQFGSPYRGCAVSAESCAICSRSAEGGGGVEGVRAALAQSESDAGSEIFRERRRLAAGEGVPLGDEESFGSGGNGKLGSLFVCLLLGSEAANSNLEPGVLLK